MEVVLKLGNGGSFGAQNSGNLLTYVSSWAGWIDLHLC